jgi:LacI family transcriptional regulator
MVGFLAANPDLTAVVCDTDVLAARLISVAQRTGRRVPGDVSVVGINDSALARSVEPTLTSVALPAQEAGRLAVARLTGSSADRQYLLTPSLVIRSSTAPAPTR